LLFYIFEHFPRIESLNFSLKINDKSAINNAAHYLAPRHLFWRKIEPLAKISLSNLSSSGLGSLLRDSTVINRKFTRFQLRAKLYYSGDVL